MDRFAELLVRKYPTSSESFKKTMMIIAAVVFDIIILLFAFISANPLIWGIMILLALGAGYLVWWLTSQMYTEYEYTVTNGDLEVAKIVAKKKRSELLETDVKKFTSFKKYSDGDELTDDELTRFHCSDGTENNLFFADFTDDTYGKSRLYFSPDIEFIENMIPFAAKDVAESMKEILETYKTETEESDESNNNSEDDETDETNESDENTDTNTEIENKNGDEE